MMEKIPGQQRVTVAGDKGYDTRGFVAECRNLQVTPHVAQNEGRRGGSATDGRTTRHADYGVSLQSCADKKSATSRVSWRLKCVWRRGEPAFLRRSVILTVHDTI